MPIYEARKQSPSYGHAIGILVLDIDCPYIPGDVGNASTFSFPVLYQTVQGCDVERILFKPEQATRDVVVEAARDLVRRGVGGISSNCGYMIRYQEAVAEAVRVPVFLSSLLQIPMILASQGRRPVGVIAAHCGALKRDLLELAGVPSEAPVIVAGMEDQPEFNRSMLEINGRLDSDLLRQEMVEVASDLHRRTPDLGAILLECAVLGPYARAVQHATGLPVYDFTTMINYFYGGNHRTLFEGEF